jgi:mevalonate kinase
MKTITVSAPGKLMLFGEHAVVYGHPCIVTAVGQRMFVTVTRDKSQVTSTEPTLRVDAPDVYVANYSKPFVDLGQGDIPKGAKFIEFAVKNFLTSQGVALRKGVGFHIETRSEFSSLFGFGSSSASTVCVIKALSELFEVKLSSKEIFDLAYKTVLDIQGKGSGFDVAAAIYGGTLYYVKGGQTILPLAIRHLPLIVGYSGIKADTVTLINKVSELLKENPALVENIYKNISTIVEDAKIALEKENWEEMGRLMNENQLFLSQLGVSIDKLDAMVGAATNAGAYGAKLSGAGGGDCMISLVTGDKKRVTRAIEKAGGEIIAVETNAGGVRVEN